MFAIHIEEFFHDTYAIMNTLYQAFPNKCNVFVEDIAGPDQPDDYGLHSKRFQSCFGTMLWLEIEGFIRFESTLRQEAIDQACLTMKGLSLLATISNDDFMDDITQKINTQQHLENPLTCKPYIDALRYIAKHGTSTQLALAMQYLLTRFAEKA